MNEWQPFYQDSQVNFAEG